MGCVSCKKRSSRINGLQLFQKRLADRKTVNTSVESEPRSISVEHKSPVSVPKITKSGWVVKCLICGTQGNPKPFAELATSDNCTCEK